jgi:hypothetical protein
MRCPARRGDEAKPRRSLFFFVPFPDPLGNFTETAGKRSRDRRRPPPSRPARVDRQALLQAWVRIGRAACRVPFWLYVQAVAWRRAGESCASTLQTPPPAARNRGTRSCRARRVRRRSVAARIPAGMAHEISGRHETREHKGNRRVKKPTSSNSPPNTSSKPATPTSERSPDCRNTPRAASQTAWPCRAE